MVGFITSLLDELSARRRRLRASLGDRGAALIDFLVLGGLALGSLGLFVRAWMAEAAPWGFWLPLVFLIGFLLIETRRQTVVKAAEAPEAIGQRYDWVVLLWSFACALAGAAAFVIAWGAQPPAPAEENVWTPPENSVPVDISP
jgi:hypothetical protein